MSRNNATMSDMKHALEGISGRLDITGEKTDELENTAIELYKMKCRKKDWKRKKKRTEHQWALSQVEEAYYTCNWSPWKRNLAKIFPNLMTTINPWIQVDQLYKIYTRQGTWRKLN